jgi:hypothetical protein
MRRILAGIGLVLVVFVVAEAKRSTSIAISSSSAVQTKCQKCRELDEQTLPDEHYFPPPPSPDLVGMAPSEPSDLGNASAMVVASRVWGEAESHTHVRRAATKAVAGSSRVSGSLRATKTLPFGGADHDDGEESEGEPDPEADWQWGGLRDCDYGPPNNSKIAVGCHESQWKNLLCNSHNECPEQESELAENAIRERDVDALRALLTHAEASKVVFNRKRRAIQVVGCDGEIARHLPVTDDFVRALFLR